MSEDKFAIIKLDGFQHLVREGEVIEAQKTEKPEAEVLLLKEGAEVKIGKPTVKGAKVTLSVLEQTRAPKIEVRRFKAKSRYRKVKGHKQPITLVKVDKIETK